MTEPVSTSVTAMMVRPYTPGMYADLTGGAAESWSSDAASGAMTLTFDADLGAATVTAIRDRMTSRDESQEAARAVLRDDRDALDEADPWRRLYDYVLGD